MYVNNIKYLTVKKKFFFNFQYPNVCVFKLGAVTISSDNRGFTVHLNRIAPSIIMILYYNV
jgi:hypothetical protein